ncbi:hypothetical protein NIES4101_48480 [Calothrix sp. NIES-4101]|nr:hypothetical protein NIES4101_48480 [Calothrix sp. NIES-4101]
MFMRYSTQSKFKGLNANLKFVYLTYLKSAVYWELFRDVTESHLEFVVLIYIHEDELNIRLGY